MGEIAEMMLDGTMCQMCGVMLVGPGDISAGYPQTCAGCSGSSPRDAPPGFKFVGVGKKVKCTHCHKRFREQRHMEQHRDAVHGGKHG